MRKDYFELTYRLRIRIVYLSVLTSLIFGFYLFPKIIESDMIFESDEYTEIMNVEIIKPIQQQQQFKSARPSIPIEADDESEIDTIDFMDTDIAGFGDWGAPPPPPSSSGRPTWVQFDSAPTPKGGPLNPKYPDLCRQAGVEGTVFASFWVDKDGKVDKSSVKIVKSIPCLDQSVIDEIKKSKWRPARQGRIKVGVPITMEFAFSLTSN